MTGQSEKSVSDRIIDLLAGRERKWLAEAAGVSESTVSDYIRRGVPDAVVKLAKIAQALDVPLDTLVTGAPPPGDGAGKSDRPATVEVPEYDIEVAAGAGRFAFEREQPIGHWPFPPAWLAQFGDPRDLKLVSVVGDSQEPEFGDGDRVLVDTSSTRPRDGMHVVRRDDTLLVKRLQVQGSTILLKSANALYGDIVVDLRHDEDQFEVIGRVVGAIRVVGNPWSR